VAYRNISRYGPDICNQKKSLRCHCIFRIQEVCMFVHLLFNKVQYDLALSATQSKRPVGPVSLVCFHFRFTTSGYIGGFVQYGFLLCLCFHRTGANQTCSLLRFPTDKKGNEKNGSNDAGLLIFRIKNTVCECYF